MNPPAVSSALPIHDKRDAIIEAIRSSQVVIVAGETGSGKTTQLPLLCLEAGFGKHGKIGITQPRRIAATSVASYVASQLSCPVGTLVGYKVRFTDRESAATKIKFMTDGILLRELQADRYLRHYDVVIIDEVHERSLNIDFLVGYMKWLLPKRPDMRLVLSSATIDTALFSAAFSNAPVITVLGRLFPIDILYHEPSPDKGEEISFAGLAAKAAQELLESSDAGDILIFLPTERDILETTDLLTGRLGTACRILPMFGRMPLAEQAAIFHVFDKRKIVVATNIAETSVTVPNIRFVVDTGLARIKRFDPSLGITRLPVEPVSQASARQRAGRCGRVQDGMCVRLYSEEDLLSRPEYTAPEIQRANLGQVILSMTSLGLGTVENFPFLQGPSRQAISQGYRSLVELGALDESKHLTDLGARMARFPIDPALSRMLLEAHQQGCMRELLIVASALCVQDMRVRPSDKKEAADAAHARFCDPLSDFLFYLKLWDACGWDAPERFSLTRLRSFCKNHFLSFVRMREWKDVHDQLASIVETRGDRKGEHEAATYERIHRCVVSGFVSHVAKKNDDGTYQVAKGRTSSLFPGSSLFKKKPDWIVSSELVETSRVYSRTCASIDPLWLESVAPHLCKRRYSEPFFDEESEGVKAKETVSFFGLTIVAGRIVGYGRIKPEEATDVFIREGLCAGRLKSHYKFYKHNLELRHRFESLEKKLRTASDFSGEENMVDFYKLRLHGISSVHELNALVRQPGAADALFMKDSDLVPGLANDVAALFPDSVTIGAAVFPIVYEFDLSSELDGPSVRITSHDLTCLNHAVFDWIVPGLYEPRIRFLLESLPRSTKQRIGDVSEAAKTIAASLSYSGEDFLDSVCESASALLGLYLDQARLPVHDLPPHLMVKVVVDKSGKLAGPNGNAAAWSGASRQWTKTDIRTWNFGDLPQKLELIPAARGFPVFGYPSLVAREGAVNSTVFTRMEDQATNHAAGVRRLAEISVEKDFAWLDRDFRIDTRHGAAFFPTDKAERIGEIGSSLVKRHCFANESFSVWKKSEFDAILKRVRVILGSQGSSLGALIASVISEYIELQSTLKTKTKSCNSKGCTEIAADLKKELGAYMDRFLNKTLNLNMLTQYPRYFKGFGLRIQRALSDPGKYLSRLENAIPYVRKSNAFWRDFANYPLENQELIFDFCMMVEEFKISLFAQQEIKTLFPISPKRLDEKLEELRKAGIVED